MNAVKQSHVPQPRVFLQPQKTVDLTRQERQALSLVWIDDDAEAPASARRDSDTAHCAVLGYN